MPKEKRLNMMNRLHWHNGIIGLLAVMAGFIAKSLYRPYAYEHELSDFGLADSAPSFFYVIGFSQLMLVKNYRYPWLLILVVTAGAILYEMMQSVKTGLDKGDVIASLLGGALSTLFWALEKNKNPSI